MTPNLPTSRRFLFDMRSDILAPPTPTILAAIIEAAGRHGEFSWRQDSIEIALEQKVSSVLGKPAAALFPTCTAANIAGLVALGAGSRKLIMEETCHLVTNEMTGLKSLTGCKPLTFRNENWMADISAALGEPDAILCLENTHNRLGGKVFRSAEVRAVVAMAKSAGWSVFLDGSRLWNAAVAADEQPAALVASVDLVSVSFNKGLAAPNGAGLAGGPKVVAAAVEAWRTLGGICRPSHVLAAGALAALTDMSHLRSDHELAKETASAISEIGSFDASTPDSNIVLISGKALGLDSAGLVAALGAKGLGCITFGPQKIRLVFHRGIPPGSSSSIAAIFAAVAKEAHDVTRH